MARKHYIVRTTDLRVEYLLGAILTSVDTLRLSPDKAYCMLKADEKSDVCAAVEKAGYTALTAAQARGVTDMWESDVETPTISAKDLSEIERASAATWAEARAEKPRLISQARLADVSEVDSELGGGVRR